MPTKRDNSPPNWDFEVEFDIEQRRTGTTIRINYTISTSTVAVPEAGVTPSSVRINVNVSPSGIARLQRQLSPSNLASIAAGPASQATGLNENVMQAALQDRLGELDFDFPNLSGLGGEFNVRFGEQATESFSRTFSIYVPALPGLNSQEVIDRITDEVPQPSITFTAVAGGGLRDVINLSPPRAQVSFDIDPADLLTPRRINNIDCQAAGFELPEIDQVESEINSVSSELDDVASEIRDRVGATDVRRVNPTDLGQNLPGSVLNNLRSRVQDLDPEGIRVPESVDVPDICGDISQSDLQQFEDAALTRRDLIQRKSQLLDLLSQASDFDCPDPSDLTVEAGIREIPDSQISLSDFEDRIGVTGRFSIQIPRNESRRQDTVSRLETVLDRFRNQVPNACDALMEQLDQAESQINDIRQGNIDLGDVDCAREYNEIYSDLGRLTGSEVGDVSSLISNPRRLRNNFSMSDINNLRSELDDLLSRAESEVQANECLREVRDRIDEARSTLDEASSILSDAGDRPGFTGGNCAEQFSRIERDVSNLEDLVGIEGKIRLSPIIADDVSNITELSQETIRRETIPDFVISDAREDVTGLLNRIDNNVNDPGCAREFRQRVRNAETRLENIISTVNADVDCQSTYPDAVCTLDGLEQAVGIQGPIRVGGFGDDFSFECEEVDVESSSEVPSEKLPLPAPRNVAEMRTILRQEQVEFRQALPQWAENSLRGEISRAESFVVNVDNLNVGVKDEKCAQLFNTRLEAVIQKLDAIVEAGEGLNLTICSDEYSSIDSDISDLEGRITPSVTFEDVETEISELRTRISDNVDNSNCQEIFNNRLDALESRTLDRDIGGDGEDGGQGLGCSDVPRGLRNRVASYESGATSFLQTPQLSNDPQALREETRNRISEGENLMEDIRNNVDSENPCRGELLNTVRRSMRRLSENIGDEAVRVEVEEGPDSGGGSGTSVEEILQQIGGAGEGPDLDVETGNSS